MSAAADGAQQIRNDVEVLIAGDGGAVPHVRVGEFGSAGGKLDDAVAAGVGEAFEGGVDRFGSDTVDGGEGERLLFLAVSMSIIWR